MTKWYQTICLDRPTTTTELFFKKRKAINKNLYSDFGTVNTGGPLNSNNERNKEESFLSINECRNAFGSIKAHTLQNLESAVIGNLNVNSLRNKVVAVEELMWYKVKLCLFLKRK